MTVVVPAGLPILDAARWVGESCWLELRAHARLTEVLASVDVDADARIALWSVRANRAETAEEWHRRLPELRELPRASFVVPPAGRVDGAAPTVAEVLSSLDRRYAAHESVAMGPADGPVAETLRRARALLTRDLESVAAPMPGSKRLS